MMKKTTATIITAETRMVTTAIMATVAADRWLLEGAGDTCGDEGLAR
jgi:hypothetical protein